MIEQQISNDDYNEDGIVIIDNNTIKHMRMQIACRKKNQCMKSEHVLKLVFHSINRKWQILVFTWRETTISLFITAFLYFFA